MLSLFNRSRAQVRICFSVTLVPIQRQFKSGEPVNINVTTSNISTNPLKFYDLYGLNPSGGSWTCKLSVIDESGNATPDTKFGRIVRYWLEDSPNVGPGTILSGNGDFVELAPGATSTKQFDLAALVDLSRPGKYKLALQKTAQGNPESVASNSVIIQITPATPIASKTTLTSSPISLSIKKLLDEGKVGQTLKAEIVTTNTSNQPVIIQMEKASSDQVGSTYKVDMHDRAGESPAETPYGLIVGNASYTPTALTIPYSPGTFLRLLPGESWMDTINIAKVYDVNRPDQYRISVRRWDGVMKTWVTSNFVNSTVAP